MVTAAAVDKSHILVEPAHRLICSWPRLLVSPPPPDQQGGAGCCCQSCRASRNTCALVPLASPPAQWALDSAASRAVLLTGAERPLS